MKMARITIKQAADLIYSNRRGVNQDGLAGVLVRLIRGAEIDGSSEYLIEPEGCKLNVYRLAEVGQFELTLSGYAADGSDVDSALARISLGRISNA